MYQLKWHITDWLSPLRGAGRQRRDWRDSFTIMHHFWLLSEKEQQNIESLGVTVQCINMLNLFSVMLLLSGAEYLKVFQADQLQALAMLFLDFHKNGFMIAQVFYGVWLFPLGYLVFKSGYLPRILGIVLMVECFSWLLYPFQFFLFPSYAVISYLSFAVGFIGEFSLTLWLLIKGVKDQKPTSIGALYWHSRGGARRSSKPDRFALEPVRF